MAEFPALPIWTDAYLADTRHLTTVEHGAYLLLLFEAWRRSSCALPDDDTLLSRLAGLSPEQWREVKPVVMAFWQRDGRSRKWTQKRLVSERQFLGRKSQVQRDKAAKRWKDKKTSDAAALPNGCPEDAPTPTPTPTLEIEASASIEPRKRAARPKTRIPVDAVISEQMRSAAIGRGLSEPEAEAQFAKFRDWAVAKGQVYADWDAAWRNWLTSPYFAPVLGAVTPFPGNRRQNDGERLDAYAEQLKATLAVRRFD